MKSKGILAMALVGVLSVSAIAPSALAATSGVINKEETTAQETVERHGKREKHEKAVEPENSIGKDAAKTAALADAGLTAEQTGKVKSRVSQLDDGTVIYKVSFTFDGQKYSYQIDAMTGKVLDKSTEDATEATAREFVGNRRRAKQANITAAAV